MSNRSERREAERAARKAAFNKLRQQRSQFAGLGAIRAAQTEAPAFAPEPEITEIPLAPVEDQSQPFFESASFESEAQPVEAKSDFHIESEPALVSQPISEKQLAANRANAQLSTGATTPEGRVRSSMNALKHGLTGKTVLLPHEDRAQYQRQLEAFITAHQPATEDELRSVQCIADCFWRIDRLMQLETAILLKGQLECPAKFEDRTPFERSHLINAEAYIKYERQLRNLNIQEARLRRTMEKEMLELARLQAIRRHQQAQLSSESRPRTQTAAAQSANGFEFSTRPDVPPSPHLPDQRTRKQAA